MNKFLFILLLSINFSYAKNICHESEKFDKCYKDYQKKYNNICYSKKAIWESEETDIDIDSIKTTNTYRIVKEKNYKTKNWFNLCFHPIKYFKMVCRKKICGYYNIK